MEEIADLLRELVAEVQGLRSDIAGIRGPADYHLGDLHAQLVELGETIGGPAAYSLQDLADRLGSPSVFGLDDLHKELVDLNVALAAGRPS